MNYVRAIRTHRDAHTRMHARTHDMLEYTGTAGIPGRQV